MSLADRRQADASQLTTEPTANVFEQIAGGDADALRAHSEHFRQAVEAEAELIRGGETEMLIDDASESTSDDARI